MGNHSIYGYKIKFVPLLLNLNIIIMYSTEDLEIKVNHQYNVRWDEIKILPLLPISKQYENGK